METGDGRATDADLNSGEPGLANDEAAAGLERGDDAILDACSRSVIGALERVGPTVVSVHVGRQRDERIEAAGDGSGAIVAPGGYVLTNQHVVHRAASVSLTLTNGD